MANLNKVMLIGRLTRDPESRSFNNGGKVVKFGFAVNNRRKNQQTGEWMEEPVFIDCEAFSGEYSKTGDVIERFLHKGSQAFIEGHLKLDQWDDKTTGAKRSALRLVVDNVQLLDRKQDGQMGDGAPARSGGAPRQQKAPAYDDAPHDEPAAGGGDGEIPF
jgi:single-strand DNA-binding protein